MSKILILLADGFEEIEALTIIDILYRARMDVVVAGVGSKKLLMSHSNFKIEITTQLEDVKNENFDMIVLPGGEPGTTNLENSLLVKEVLLKQIKKKGKIASICATPRILAGLGLLDHVKVTSFPGVKHLLKNAVYLEDKVVIDGQFITSRGPGTAGEFTFSILEVLGHTEIAHKLKIGMHYA